MQLFVTEPTWRRGWMPARSSICPSWYNPSVSLLPPGLTALRQ